MSDSLKAPRELLQGEVERLRKALEDIRDEQVIGGVTKGTYMYFKLLSAAHKNIAIEALELCSETPSESEPKTEGSGTCSCHITGLKECPTHKEWPKKYWGESQPPKSPQGAPKESEVVWLLESSVAGTPVYYSETLGVTADANEATKFKDKRAAWRKWKTLKEPMNWHPAEHEFT